MMVRAQYCGNRAAGLYIGVSNARRYFSKRIGHIELQLDNLQIICGLTPHFWQDKPEIQDPRLCVWLETKHPRATPHWTEVPMALIPAGKNTFRLAAVMQESRAPFSHARVRTAQSQMA